MPVSKTKTYTFVYVFCFYIPKTYIRPYKCPAKKKIANSRQNDKRNVAFDLCVLNMRDKERDERLFFCLK